MCSFFSFITNGDGKLIYHTAVERRNWDKDYAPDSHSAIALKVSKKPGACDYVNKYEYFLGELMCLTFAQFLKELGKLKYRTRSLFHKPTSAMRDKTKYTRKKKHKQQDD